MMIVKEQKKITFINNCNAIFDEEELSKAIMWYSTKPVISKKHIYMYGCYPAISIHDKKIHIHRLLMMYWNKQEIKKGFIVHHIDGNKLNASKENLEIINSNIHASLHNKNKTISEKVKNKIIESNHARKGTRYTNQRKDISYKKVNELYNKGYSINKIAKELNADWTTIKARMKDIFDNPELIEGGAE